MSGIEFEVVNVSAWTADGETYPAGEVHTADAKLAPLLAAAADAEPTHFKIRAGKDELAKAAARHVEDEKKSMGFQERITRIKRGLPAEVTQPLETLRDETIADIRAAYATKIRAAEKAKEDTAGLVVEREQAIRAAALDHEVRVDVHVQAELEQAKP